MQNKKILITGGLGLVGSNLTRTLVSRDAKVTLLTRSLSNIKNIEDIKDKVEVIQGDIRNYEEVEKAIKGKDHIFHLAGQSSVPKSMQEPFLDLDTNYKATLNILEVCKKINPQANIVFAGTIREAGPIENTYAKENQRESPTSLFDLHKLASEKALQIYNSVHNLKTTTLRFSNIFGPNQYNTDPHISVINHIVKKALIEKSLEVYGLDSSPIRDYNYVENVVDACILAALSTNTKGKYYIIGSGEGRTFKQFLESLEKISKDLYNIKIKIKEIPSPQIVEKTAQGNIIADYSKFKEATSWYPKTSFEEGLKKTIHFYKNIV